jgi:hypothetical protein
MIADLSDDKINGLLQIVSLAQLIQHHALAATFFPSKDSQ